VAVARPQHQPVIAKANRALVSVDGGVQHIENSHRRTASEQPGQSDDRPALEQIRRLRPSALASFLAAEPAATANVASTSISAASSGTR
jgi:hypothetical protein